MQEEIGKYYDQTQVHYERWWQLNRSLSLHYGIWLDNTQSFAESLQTTNRLMAEMAGIAPGSLVLDAGCGVAGAAIYLASKYGAVVRGVTLSQKQLKTANRHIKQLQLESKVEVSLQDFTHTSFPDSSFDVIWACESLCHLEEKSLFFKEANRLLKPGGRLIISDFFQSKPGRYHLLDQWSASWAMASMPLPDTFAQALASHQFHVVETKDFTREIWKTSRRLYRASLLGSIPSILYNLVFDASEYARKHYKSGMYQYQALKQDLWKYQMVLAEKT